jgi:hypothetical protein
MCEVGANFSTRPTRRGEGKGDRSLGDAGCRLWRAANDISCASVTIFRDQELAKSETEAAGNM